MTAASAQPLMPNIIGRLTRRATASATAVGRLPPPQIIASEPASGLLSPMVGVSDGIVGGRTGARIDMPFVARTHQRTLAAGTDEGDDFAHHRIAGEFALDRFEAVGEAAFDEEQQSIGTAYAVHLGPGRAAPSQPNHIQPDQRAGLTERKAERDDVVTGGRHARHHDALPDAHELMNGDMAAEKGVIADVDVATEHDVVGQCDVVADLAIVPDMGAHHERAAVADTGYAAAGLGAGIHRTPPPQR